MKKEMFYETFNLNNSIAPQYFSIQEKGICYFDRVNAEEGRFWHIREGKHSIAFETDEGQGMLDDMGNMYILSSGEKSILTPIHEGKPQLPIELNGMFYDFKISRGGSYVFLGNKDGNSLIHIKNSNGIDIAEIAVPELMFASCLALDKENIYLGGIEKGGRLAVISMDYLGCMKESWSLDCNPKERFVGKLQLYGRKIIMLIEGAYDTIGVLDMAEGEFKEVRLNTLSLKGCADLQLFKKKVYILSGKSLVSMDIEELESVAEKPSYGLSLRNKDSLSYEYLMYTRGMRTQAASSLLPGVIVSSLITAMLLMTGQIYFNSYMQQGIFQLLMTIIGAYLIASLRNVVKLSDKVSRVDSLLSLYNESSTIFSRYVFPFIASATVFAFVYLLGYPGIGRMYSWILGPMAMIMFSAIQITCLRKLRLEKDDVIVELLRDDDIETELAIRAALKSMRREGCEELLIKIATDDKGVVHRIHKWADTRKGIIGEMKGIMAGDDMISVILDFSKRDIRYSRFSIAMDYISYLRKSGMINIMDIECCSFLKK